MEIPDSVFDLFDEGVTAMLNSPLAPLCILIYPTKKTPCINCITNTMGNISTSQYKSGGPIVFANGQVCPYCHGVGYTEQENTATLNLLIDWEPKEYKDIVKTDKNVQLNYPGGIIKVQGFITNVKDFRQATEIRVAQDLSSHGYWRYVRRGEPIPYGLHHNIFFSCLMDRIG